jgi:hypothetical protein
MALRLIRDKIKGLGSESSLSGSSRSSSKEREKANGSNGSASPPTNPKYRPHDEIVTERIRRSEDKLKRRSNSVKSMSKRRDEIFLEEGPEELTKLYKPLSMNMSRRRNYAERFSFKDLDIESKYLI